MVVDDARSVTQHVADLVERGAFAQHVGRKAVPQQMGADVFLRRLEAGPVERVA